MAFDASRQLVPITLPIPSFAWIAGRDGVITWYNRPFYDYTGATPQEMETEARYRLYHPKVLPRARQAWFDAVTEGRAFQMIVPILGWDGVFRPFLTRMAPTRNAAREITGWVGANIDMTSLGREGPLADQLRDVEAFTGPDSLSSQCVHSPSACPE